MCVCVCEYIQIKSNEIGTILTVSLLLHTGAQDFSVLVPKFTLLWEQIEHICILVRIHIIVFVFLIVVGSSLQQGALSC